MLLATLLVFALQTDAARPWNIRCPVTGDDPQWSSTIWLGRFCSRDNNPRGFIEFCWTSLDYTRYSSQPINHARTWQDVRDSGQLDIDRVRSNVFTERHGVNKRMIPRHPGIQALVDLHCPHGYACEQKLDPHGDAHIICIKDNLNGPTDPDAADFTMPAIPGEFWPITKKHYDSFKNPRGDGRRSGGAVMPWSFDSTSG